MTKEDNLEMTMMKRIFLITLAVAMTACSPKNTVPSGNRDVLAEGWTLSREGRSSMNPAQECPRSVLDQLYARSK